MYFNKRMGFVFAAAVLVTGFLHAQETHNLTVENAVEFAVQGNISLKQSQLSLDTAKKASDFSWNSFVPSVSASASLQETFGDTGKTVINAGASASLSLRASLYTSIQNTKLNYEKNLMDYESAVRSIELQVRKIYYSLLYEQENIVLLKNRVTTAKNQYDTTEAKYNRGAIARLDVLQAQVSYQNSVASLKSAENSFASDLDSFKILLGLPLESSISLSGSLDSALEIGDISIENIEVNSASVQSIKKQIEIAENNLLATRFSAYSPSLNASASYSLSNALGSYKGTPSVSLSASIPLDGFMPWSSGALSIDSQKNSLESLYLSLDSAQKSSAATIQKYLNQLQIQKETIALRQQSVEIAQQSYNLTLEAYNRGSKDLLVLQNSADSLLQAQVNLKSEAYNMEVALLNLEDALGVPYGSLSK